MEHKGGIPKRLRLRLPERLRVRRRAHSSSQGASSAIKSWLGLTWSLFGVGLFLLSSLIVTLQVREEVTLIEEFGVPEDLAKQGWTGRAVAKGLLDELQHIQIHATTRMDRVPFSSSWSVQSPDMVVAGTSVPLSSLVRHLRELFGVTTRQIDGEVILEGKEILLVARVDGSEGRTFSAEIGERGQARTIQRLLASAAQYVLEETAPYVLASFYSATDDRRCVSMIEVCLRNDSSDDDPWAYNLWGVILMESKPVEAAAKFQRAIDLDPKFDLPYRNWGRLLISQNELGKAVAKLETALELRPDADSYANLGIALLKDGRASEAFEKLQRSVELDPKLPHAWLGLGKYYADRSDEAKALDMLREAVLVRPDFERPYELLASVTKDPVEADGLRKELLRRRERALRKTIEANPESGTSHSKLAAHLESLFRYDEAEAEYRAAIEVEDTLAEAHNGLGGILLRYRRHDEAIDHFWRATELNPGLAAAYSNWGLALSDLGNHEQALVRFRKAAALDRSSDNLLNVGVCLFRLNRPEESLQELREALKKSPDSNVARQNGCLVARKLGETAAIREFCPPAQVRVASGRRTAAGVPVPLPATAGDTSVDARP